MKYSIHKLKRRLIQFGSIHLDKYQKLNNVKNWSRFPRFAAVVFILSMIYLLQHWCYPSMDTQSFLYTFHFYIYFSMIVITIMFFLLLYFLNKKNIKIHILYFIYCSFFILGIFSLNILKLFQSQDLSLYAMGLISIPLIYKSTIKYYSIMYLILPFLFSSLIYIFHYSNISFITISQVFMYTLVGFLTTLSIEYSRRKSFLLVEELRRKNIILESISVRDPLTGVYNRRYMMDLLVHHILLSKRHRKPLTQGIVDIDHFKKINDTLGHLTGDDVLREIAKIIKSAVRDSDLVFRFGGEEFIVIFPETALDKSKLVMDRIRTSIESNAFNGVPWTVTASGGFTELLDTDSPDSILKRSDELLYKAKTSGRNRILY